MTEWRSAKARRDWLRCSASVGRSSASEALIAFFHEVAGPTSCLPFTTSTRSVHACSLDLRSTLAFVPKISESRFLMHNEFTAIFERDGDCYLAYCPEIPGANGQGRTKEEERASLAEAIALILHDRREDALRGTPPDAERETLTLD